MIKSIKLKLIFTCAALLAAIVSFAQTQERSVWDGVFSLQQAQRGAALYASQCASCHGEKLDGQGPVPPLAGSDFMGNWTGMTIGDLYEKVQTSMPADKPGSLTPQQTADVLSYLLQMNKLPVGAMELPVDAAALRKIRVETQKKN